MNLGKNLLKKIASNARLELSEAEIKEFLPQLKETLRIFEKLKEVQTDKIQPSFQPIEVKNILREDKVGKCLPLKDVFSGIKNKQDNYFKGPKAV